MDDGVGGQEVAQEDEDYNEEGFASETYDESKQKSARKK